MDNVSLQEKTNPIPLIKYQYLGSIASDKVPTPDNDTFAIINTQRSNMQCRKWIMIAKFAHEMYFVDFLGRKTYHFFKKHYKWRMPAQLLSKRTVWGLYTIYAAFHLLKFCQEEIFGAQDYILL